MRDKKVKRRQPKKKTVKMKPKKDKVGVEEEEG